MLSFEFINLSKSPIQFDNGFLSRDQINLYVIKDRILSDAFEESFTFSYPSLENILIEPNKKHQFVIDLNRTYQEFSKAITKDNVLIFWHIKLKPLSIEHEMLRFGGYLVVDKKINSLKVNSPN